MAWLDQLQAASFKGVPFQVDSIDVQFGDNLVVREYPFQDLPTVFRLGTAAEEIRFSAYVIGDDYIDQREALRDALTGSGLLVHPTAGAMRVFVAGKPRVTENPTAEGGMARFDLHFVRAEPRRYPVAAASTASAAALAADQAKAAAVDDFAGRFSLAGVTGWVGDQVTTHLGDVLGTVFGQVNSAASGLGDFQSGLIGGYQALRDALNTLVSSPRALANQVRLLFDLPSDMSKVAQAGYRDAMAGLFNVGGGAADQSFVQRVVPTVVDRDHPIMYGLGDPAVLAQSSDARTTLSALKGAVNNLCGTLAVAAYVQAISQSDLGSYDESLAMRAALFEQITGLLTQASKGKATSSVPATAWHDAMVALLSAGLADLQGRGFNAQRLTTLTTTKWTPVWCISHDLYGSAAYADEILQLNPAIRHPLLVPPGLTLKVVNRG